MLGTLSPYASIGQYSSHIDVMRTTKGTIGTFVGR